MSNRHQNGYIFRKGAAWYLRYYEIDASGDRKQRCRKLVDFGDSYRCRSDVRSLAEDFLRPLNGGRFSPQSTLPIAEYVESHYLPHVLAELRPSTYANYKALWETYLEVHLKRATLRDFRRVDATNVLAEVHREHGLGHTTLKHLKSLLSGVFTHAKRQGVLDGANPVRDAVSRAGPRDRGKHTRRPLTKYWRSSKSWTGKRRQLLL